MDKLYTSADIKLKEGKITGVASTSVVDRQNESVNVEGWDLKMFKKAPRLLWAHDHTEPAIGKVTKIQLEGEGKRRKLTFEAMFQEVTDKAKAIKQLVEDGFINTFSVGFRPLEMEDNQIIRQELLEISVVNVPANPEAMLLAYKDLKDAGFEKSVIDSVLKQEMPSGMAGKMKKAMSSMQTAMGHMEDMMQMMKADDTDYVHPLQADFNELKDQLNQVNEKAELAVKGLKHLNPHRSKTEVTTTRLALSKVIARSADKMLEEKPSVDLAKVIKRSSETLIRSHKEDLNG